MKVTLTHPLLGDREFDKEHAQRILGRPNNGGWKKKVDATRTDRAKKEAGKKAKEGRDKSGE